ncbi:MAG: phenylalanine--tRNA ligase subunit beta [Candidatus Omnitrophota bacterium]
MRVTLNWLKDFVHIKAGLEEIKQALTMTGLEVEGSLETGKDHVMDIEITPNRPDCLSIIGVARELASATKKTLNLPASIKKSYMKKGPARGKAKVEIEDKKACPRYVGCIMKNVKVGPSPEWLVERLNAMGVRSVNNIVDITNYVLFETGQPLHAFDLEKLEKQRIIVRRARKGEELTTIDGVRRELDPTMLIIADDVKPVAVAGIMGGLDTEITEETKTIFLESAYFDPVSVRKTQRKLALASESSYRFERGVDPAMVYSASMRAQEMIKNIAKARCSGNLTDVGGKILKEKEISLDLGEIPRILGIDISRKDVIASLAGLDLKISKKTKNKITVKVPIYRQDLERDIDLIEEIVRIYGYDKVPSKLPRLSIGKLYEEEKKTLTALKKRSKEILTRLGLNEVVTYTLTSRASIETLGISFDNVVRLQNPLSANQAFMRPTLVAEMLEVLSWNINRRNSLVKLFEINKVYSIDRAKNEIKEKNMVSMAIFGNTPGNWKEHSREIDFFDMKGVVEKFLVSLGVKDYKLEKGEYTIFREDMALDLKIGNIKIGSLGEVKEKTARFFDIKDKVYIAEIDFEELIDHVIPTRFKALPKYPSMKRDISMIASNDLSAENIFNVIRAEGGGLVTSIDIFDIYKGQQIQDGKKSLAYSVEYRSDEKTLKDEDVQALHMKVQEALVKKLGVEIR